MIWLRLSAFGEMLARHEIRDERLARRAVEGARGGAERCQQVDRPDHGQAGERERREGDGHERCGHLRHHHQAAPVERVGDDAAQQREHHDRPDANQADDAEREASPIRGHEQRHMPQDRRLLHHRAGERNQLSEPEQAEVAMLKGDEHPLPV